MSRKNLWFLGGAVVAVWLYYHYRKVPGSASGDAVSDLQIVAAPPVLDSSGAALPQGTFGPSAPNAAQGAYDNIISGIN